MRVILVGWVLMHAFDYFFGPHFSVPVTFLFIITGAIILTLLPDKTSKQEAPNDQSKIALTDEAKSYLERRVQDLNIQSLKTQPVFRDYEQDDLRYMGLGKN